LAGKALINYPIELSNKAQSVSGTYIFSNNQNILELIDSRLNFTFLSRSTFLDSQGASIESIIKDFLNQVDADVIVLLHPKSPFVSFHSLSECIDKVIKRDYDSAFTARIEKKFAWMSGRRINYGVINGTPHLSDVQPITIETSSMYVFTRDCFEKSGTRIGSKPYIKAVNSFEGLVINEPDDIKLAEFLLDSQFNLWR
jgi:CMP-N-acetylneuraminic acid synthetase